MGHGYNKAYLYKLGHTNNDKCRCGSRETVAHLLLSCPEANIPRKIMRDALNTSLSLPILLHTTKGIELTIQFLQTTKMSTRRWHIERNQEEEDEGEDENEEGAVRDEEGEED